MPASYDEIKKWNRTSRRRHGMQLRKIGVIPCHSKLTAVSGLGTMLEVFDSSPFAKEFAKCLPERTSHRSVGSYLLGMMLVAGHMHGLEALADIAKLRKDPYLAELFEDEVAASRTIGDFLRDFDEEHIEKLNLFLNNMSNSVMKQFAEVLPKEYQPKEKIIDIDSTYHQQYGDQTEGCNWNYKWQWSLETQIAYNQLGLCHGMQMRSGNTKSGTDVECLIRQCFKDSRTSQKRKLAKKDFFRADSAYCHQGAIKECLDLGVQFTITANDATTRWKSLMEKEGLSWREWKYSLSDKLKAEKKEYELPKSEVARFHWKPSWADGNLVFPIVVKRTWKTHKELKKDGSQGSLFDQIDIKNDGQWEYYAIVTNLNLNEWSLQEVFEHHRKRGNAENFVKEEKYNFKLKRFPCQKLLANHAWGLLAQVAHNVVRWLSILESPDKPHYAKKMRNRFIFSPGKLVKHARKIVLKVSYEFYEEVMRIRERWRLNSERSPLQYSTA